MGNAPTDAPTNALPDAPTNACCASIVIEGASGASATFWHKTADVFTRSTTPIYGEDVYEASTASFNSAPALLYIDSGTPRKWRIGNSYASPNSYGSLSCDGDCTSAKCPADQINQLSLWDGACCGNGGYRPVSISCVNPPSMPLTNLPTTAPTDATNAPTNAPTNTPTDALTNAPTNAPAPTNVPTNAPTDDPGKCTNEAEVKYMYKKKGKKIKGTCGSLKKKKKKKRKQICKKQKRKKNSPKKKCPCACAFK